MGCSAEMGMPMYDGCTDCAPASSYGVPGYPMPEAPVTTTPGGSGAPITGGFPANP